MSTTKHRICHADRIEPERFSNVEIINYIGVLCISVGVFPKLAKQSIDLEVRAASGVILTGGAKRPAIEN